ncbi:MAG TPA: biliverdin-producing heme oxygenase [Microthrixaceae bacterium]|nr:biliverdin-producing heme oxygenase [Microthrixaceae bacterium]
MNPITIADQAAPEVEPAERFSLQLRKATTSDHRSAEHSSAMTDLIRGELPLDGFVRMQAQVAFVYDALESAADRLVDDPIAGPFVDERLRRLPSLRRDLEVLGGTEVAVIEPTAATKRYCDRITSIADDWSAGLVAHHYTRYLGDLSGGQHIRGVVERVYGIDADSGSSFFHFADLDDADVFKGNYRKLLDGMPLTPEEQLRFVEEVSTAYSLSTEMFISLD